MTLESFCDIVILIGSAYFMILKIFDSFSKPTSKYKQKKEEKQKEYFKAVLDEVMPQYLLAHDIETRKRYLVDRRRYLEEIRDDVLRSIDDKLDEIFNNNQLITVQVKAINQGTKDMLRQRIMNIYYDYKKEKAFPIYIKEALDELYKDYKGQDGNSYIDKYYNRMKTWTVIDEEEYDN